MNFVLIQSDDLFDILRDKKNQPKISNAKNKTKACMKSISEFQLLQCSTSKSWKVTQKNGNIKNTA